MAVLPVRYYQLYKVIVNVTDINDHAPIFHRRSTFVLNISESAQPGTQFSLPVADDRDSQQYAVVEYRLEPAEMQRIFTLQVATEADGSQQVCCRVTYLRGIKLVHLVTKNYKIALFVSHFCLS